MQSNLFSMSTTELGKYSKVFLRDKLKTLGLDLMDNNLDDANICAKVKDKYYKFKVKSIRKPSTGYIKIKKKDIDTTDESLFIATILFYNNGISKIFLIPAVDLTKDNDLFRSRDYPKGKSTPEWGLNVTEKNMDTLNQYEISEMLKKLV
ncbi:hypothetical protein NBE98_08615 [Clostridium swellfunianum]|uniref:hypothetical protein n=1 Tax=Clostridium swellfunianum TaxID=1367462 RepID=UPI00202DD9E9|nr:hypothetical protein [Clostridium swellfunianum]MCM0648435.1 hypothetical protein [Clostridium swellfunianum]